MVPLNQLKPGDVGIIRKISGKQNFLSRVTATGFSLNAKIEMIQNYRLGPLIVSLRNTEVALGRDEASCIVMETSG